MSSPLGMHRDIYAGVVAGQLCESGYYGEEFHFFGFVVWQDGQAQEIIAHNENAIYQALAAALNQGAVVSPVISKAWRLQIEEAQRESTVADLTQQLNDMLAETYPAAFREAIGLLQQKAATSQGLPLLQNYLQTLDAAAIADKAQVLHGLIAAAQAAGVLDAAGADALRQSIPPLAEETADAAEQRVFSGFAWLDGQGQWQYYTNGYQPVTLRKATTWQGQGIVVSPIWKMAWPNLADPVPQVREQFQQALVQQLDAGFLAVVQALAQLPPAAGDLALPATDGLSPEAQQTLAACRTLWRLQ